MSLFCMTAYIYVYVYICIYIYICNLWVDQISQVCAWFCVWMRVYGHGHGHGHGHGIFILATHPVACMLFPGSIHYDMWVLPCLHLCMRGVFWVTAMDFKSLINGFQSFSNQVSPMRQSQKCALSSWTFCTAYVMILKIHNAVWWPSLFRTRTWTSSNNIVGTLSILCVNIRIHTRTGSFLAAKRAANKHIIPRHWTAVRKLRGSQRVWAAYCMPAKSRVFQYPGILYMRRLQQRVCGE